MEHKYHVPALDRASAVLDVIGGEPYKWKLSDLSKTIGISKSTLYSLLVTMERLQWVSRDRNETYAIGSALGRYGSAFFRQYDLIEDFRRLAEPVMLKLQESIQLAVLEGSDVLYLSKMEAPTPVQMVSGPGVRFPAHATGLGKVLLADMNEERISHLYPEEALHPITVHTISSRAALIRELGNVRKAGFATDLQEGVMGFCCTAAPIRKRNGDIAAAVSCSMPIHHWEEKKELAMQEIVRLAQKLSNV